MSTTQKISARILFYIECGKSVTEAIDIVLGAGTSDRLINDVYNTLRQTQK